MPRTRPGAEGASADDSEAMSPVEDDESEEIMGEIVEDDDVIELPPLPRPGHGQFRVPASEILTADGIPVSRTRASIARRLDGYDPLQHWRR